MEIWLDSIDLETIQTATEMGLLHGITTNPSLIAKNSRQTMRELLPSLLLIQKGPVTAQVLSRNASSMVEEARSFFALSSRIIVKIPATREGFIAMRRLSALSIPVMATAVYSPLQVLLSCKAGAGYVAIYLSRVFDSGEDGFTILERMYNLMRHYQMEAKLMAASIRSLEQMERCLAIGIPSITISPKIFSELILDNPFTLERLDSFEKDWKLKDASLGNPLV